MRFLKSTAGKMALAWMFAAGFCGIGQAAQPSLHAVFTGMPDQISWRASWLEHDPVPPCIVFGVRTTSAAEVTLAVNGIGKSRMSLAPAGQCPTKGTGWAPELQLAKTSLTQLVALQLAPEPFQTSSATGQISAVSEGAEIGSAELKLLRKPIFEPWSEFKWFFGFVLPSVLALISARWLAERAERLRQQDLLVVFRTTNRNTVDEAVQDVSRVLTKLNPAPGKAREVFANPGWQVLQTLDAKGVIDKLPTREREPLIRACEKNKMSQVVRRLGRLFPLHQVALKDAAKSGGLKV